MFCIIRAISVIRGAKLFCLMPDPSGSPVSVAKLTPDPITLQDVVI